MTQTLLVTGAAGFIGSHIVDGALAAGYAVRALDNFSTGRRENLAFVEAMPADVRSRYTLIEGDIRDAALVRSAMQGVFGVLHQAALPSVVRSVADPIDAHDVNITGTLNLLWAAHAAGTTRFVIASSSAVYGDREGLPKREDMPICAQSPYALTKAVCESYALLFSQLYNVETVCLRYFNVFGPRQSPFSDYAAVVPAFITRLLAGHAPTIYGDGKQSRDFTYIADVVAANLAALRAQNVSGAVVNVGCGTRYTLLELLDALRPVAGAIAPHFEPPRAGDVRDSQADITRARTLLGYVPSVDLAEGLRRTTEALRTEPTASRR